MTQASPRKGKGTKIRFAVLENGSKARPLDAAFVNLPGMQSSELTRSEEMADTPTGDYETTGDNVWQDGDEVERLSWGFTISGHITDAAAQKSALDTIYDTWAARGRVWIERLKAGDTHWKGGRAILQGPTEPADWDGEQGFSVTVLGQGELTKLAVTP